MCACLCVGVWLGVGLWQGVGTWDLLVTFIFSHKCSCTLDHLATLQPFPTWMLWHDELTTNVVGLKNVSFQADILHLLEI